MSVWIRVKEKGLWEICLGSEELDGQMRNVISTDFTDARLVITVLTVWRYHGHDLWRLRFHGNCPTISVPFERVLLKKSVRSDTLHQSVCFLRIKPPTLTLLAPANDFFCDDIETYGTDREPHRSISDLQYTETFLKANIKAVISSSEEDTAAFIL